MARPKGKAEVEKRAQQLETLRVEYVDAATLQPNSYNPNRQSSHDFELLVRSMLEDGFTQPIVVQQATREIVDGEHRWTAAIVVAAIKARKAEPTEPVIEALRHDRLALAQQYHPEVPVVMVDMTPEQMRISTLRHNRARGSEDIELTAAVMRDLQRLGALDWAADSLMLTPEEVEKLLKDIPAPEALAGESWSPAWVPDNVGDEGQDLARAGTTLGAEIRAVDHGGTTLAALSPAAIEALRDRERRLAAAKSAEEARMAREGTQIYRLSLMLSGEEAELVRRVLGAEPAVKLIELCRSVG